MRRSLFLLFASSLCAQHSGNPPVSKLLEALNRTVTYRDIAISPDGEQLAWVQGTAGSRAGIIHMMRASGGPDREVALEAVPATREDKTPAWSPDSRSLVFCSNTGDNGDPQLWVVDATSRAARKLARLKGFAQRPRWSPDGKQIAFLYVEGATGGGPLMAAGSLTGVIDNAFHNQRIAIADAGSGQIAVGSPADRHVYDFDWSPDGKRFVATAAPGPGDNNWWIAQLYLFDAATASGRPIYKPKLQIAVPRWSPDGGSIAFIEGLMS